MTFKKFVREIPYIIQGWSLMILDLIVGRSNQTASKRYSICLKCKYMKWHICTICNCVVEAKVRPDYYLDEDGISIGGCPKRKW